MNRAQYMEFHRKCCDKMIKITEAKNQDYAGNGTDAFANFRGVEMVGVTTTEVGFLTRMFDKFCRITSFVNKGVLYVKDESVEDTLLDLANYCILFAGYLKTQKKKQTNEVTDPVNALK